MSCFKAKTGELICERGTDAPEIAVVAMVEHSGEGSTYAAPLVRKVVEAYFGVQPETTPTAEPTTAP